MLRTSGANYSIHRHAAGGLIAYGSAMQRVLASDQPIAVAKPNREEWAELAEHTNTDPSQPRVAELHITDGGAGVTIHTEAGAWQLTPPPITEVNAIGSGDCYLAALAGALSGLNDHDRWRLAAGAGAANASRDDVAAIGLPEAETLAAQTTIVPA